MKGYFVAGTDTGVGKTEIARALCLLLAEAGLSPLALKPVETGCEPDAPQDALALRAACGPPGNALPLARVCPYRFRLPAAPLAAAEAEGAVVDLSVIEKIVAEAARPTEAAQAARPIVVEAAGGLLVPLAREVAQGSIEQADSARGAPALVLVTNLDLAERLGLPVVLVGRAGLGTLNHCALSAQALLARGLTLAAIVLNRVAAVDDPSVAGNAALVAELTGARVLGPTPFVVSAAGRPRALLNILSVLR